MAAKDPVTPEPNVEQPDSPTTHKKGAQYVAIALVCLLVGGLFLQSFLQMRARANREAPAPVPVVESSRPRVSNIADFEKRQLEVEATTEAKKVAEAEASPKVNPAATGEDGKKEVDPYDPVAIQRAFDAAELRRALEARRTGMGKNSGDESQAGVAGAPSAAGTAGAPRRVATVNASPAGDLQARQSALQAEKAQIAQRGLDTIREAQSRGIQLPPTVIAQLTEHARSAGLDVNGANGGTRAPAAAATPAVLPSMPQGGFPFGMLQTSGAGTARTPGAELFGESALNRASRAPMDSGPKPGEKLLPTTTVIPVVLNQDVISDYAGNWTAVLQRPVYDTTLDDILLPAGTKFTGKTVRASGVNEPIQNRLAFTVLWAVRPDGKRIDFRRAQAVDVAGVAAVKDEVDRHLFAQMMGVLAYAVIGLGPTPTVYGGNGQLNSRDIAVAEATANARGIGRDLAGKYLNLVPTVRIRAGTPMKIVVEDDIYVSPWTAITPGHYAQ
jgi:type IV secretion system protein VirB10